MNLPTGWALSIVSTGFRPRLSSTIARLCRRDHVPSACSFHCPLASSGRLQGSFASGDGASTAAPSGSMQSTCPVTGLISAFRRRRLVGRSRRGAARKHDSSNNRRNPASRAHAAIHDHYYSGFGWQGTAVTKHLL